MNCSFYDFFVNFNDEQFQELLCKVITNRTLTIILTYTNGIITVVRQSKSLNISISDTVLRI